MYENEPPTYHPPAPSETTVYTGPIVPAKGSIGWPLAASISTPLPVGGPTVLKSPPR